MTLQNITELEHRGSGREYQIFSSQDYESYLHPLKKKVQVFNPSKDVFFLALKRIINNTEGNEEI